MIRTIEEIGKCICIRESMGTGGLEGYLKGDSYHYEKLKDDKGIYFRVFHQIIILIIMKLVVKIFLRNILR